MALEAKGRDRMIKDNRNTSKLAIAGLIGAIAAPCLAGLYAVLAVNGLDNNLGWLPGILFVIPFIALPLSIAGVIVSIMKDKKGKISGLVGLTLSGIEIVLIIISISDTLTRMHDYTPM